MLPWVAVMLCAAPEAPPLVAGDSMTVNEAADAPLWLLRLPELEAEDARLSELPPISHPLVAVIGGGAIALIAGIASAFLFSQPRIGRDNITSSIEGMLAFAFATSGGLMALIGAAVLPATLVSRGHYRARRAQVQARMASLREHTVAEPSLHARIEGLSIEAERPSLVLPVLLIACGTAPLAAGVGVYVGTNRGAGANTGVLAYAITLMVLGIAAEALGMWQLITRMQTRDELDERLHALEPPADDAPVSPLVPATSLPRVPMQLAWGWKF